MIRKIHPKIDFIKGNFQQLTQYIGIGFDRKKESKVVDLFTFTEKEVNYLKALSVKGNKTSLENRKYCHIYYFCELAYTLAIFPGKSLPIQSVNGNYTTMEKMTCTIM